MKFGTYLILRRASIRVGLILGGKFVLASRGVSEQGTYIRGGLYSGFYGISLSLFHFENKANCMKLVTIPFVQKGNLINLIIEFNFEQILVITGSLGILFTFLIEF